MHNSVVSKTNLIFDKTRLEKFFYGPFFPIYVALLVTLSFLLDIPFLGLSFISLSATVIFLSFKDCSPIFPLLFMVVMVFRDYNVMNGITGYLILLPPAIAIVTKFFIHPVKNFRPGKLFLPIIGVCIALFLSGMLSNVNNYSKGLVSAVTIGPVMLIIYVFFSAYVNPPKNFDVKKYISYVLIISGLTVFSHVCIYHMHMDFYKNNAFSLFYLGWGNVNCAATFLLLSIAACWYMITQVKNILPFFFILALLYLGVLLTYSDGSTGICLIFAPILAFFTYRKLDKYHRRTYIKILFVVILTLLVAAIITIVYYGFDSLLLTLKPHFSDSSRTKLYQEALDLFAQYPVFGAGLGYKQPEDLAIFLYNFHSVFFHVIATMGIIGVIAYVFYYVARFKILMEKNTCFSLFMTIAFIMFECYAFIDVSEFNAIPLMSTVTVLLAVVEFTNKKSNDEPLPLFMNFYNNVIF